MLTQEEIEKFLNHFNVKELNKIKDYLDLGYYNLGNIYNEIIEIYNKVEMSKYPNPNERNNIISKIEKLNKKELEFLYEIIEASSISNISEIDDYVPIDDNRDNIEEVLLSELERKNNEYYMCLAEDISLRSEDPHTKVGSCIVSEDGEILSIGINSKPKEWTGKFPWERDIEKLGEENTKYPYVIHSEANALNNYDGPKSKLKNATIYVTLFPCNECAKKIVEAGIKRVVYKSDKYKDTKDNMLSKLLLTACNIEYIQFEKNKIKEKSL